MNLIIVGEKPAPKTYKGPTSLDPAHNKQLHQWLMYLDICGESYLINVSDVPGRVYLDDETLDNFGPRLLDKMLELDYRGEEYRVISLGMVAHEALSMINVDHYPLPDPAIKYKDKVNGRKINFKKYLATALNECYAYIHEESDHESYIVQVANARNRKLV